MFGAYVGARLKEVELTQAVQGFLQDHGFEILYDWTTHGSLRGHGEGALSFASTREVRACRLAERAVFLLATGDKTRQAGVHVELGAFLGSIFSGTKPGRRALLWTPPEYAYIFDSTCDRTVAFYFDSHVDRVVCPRDEVVGEVAHWLGFSRVPG